MIKKIILIIVIVGSGLIIFTNKTKASESYSYDNLGSPDLTGKEYLGDGFYILGTVTNGITIKYNVYNGIYTLNGVSSGSGSLKLFSIDNTINLSTFLLTYVGGDYNGTDPDLIGFLNGNGFGTRWVSKQNNAVINYDSYYNNIGNISFPNSSIGFTYNNYQFKLQIEEGTTATPYQVPIQALKQHVQLEKEKSYNDGLDDGWWMGYDDGLDDGYDFVLNNLFDLLTDNILTYYVGSDLDGLTTIGGLDYNYYHGGQLFLNGYAITDLASFNQHLTAGKKYIFMFSNSPTYLFWSSAFHNDIQPFNLNYIIVDFIDNNNWYFYFYDAKNVLQYELNNVYLDSPFVYVPVGENPDYMYQVGLNNGRKDGFNDGYDGGYNDGVNSGYNNGYDAGYNKGVSESIESGGFSMILSSMFTSVGVLLSVELLPNISIGSIVAIPIVFGVIMFIIGRKKE